MAKWARLDGANTVIEVFDHDDITPDKTHIPEIAEQFIRCPDFVTPGSQKNGDTWTEYTPPSPGPAMLPVLSPMDFYLSFQLAERMAIKKTTDPIVVEFWATYNLAAQLNHPIDPNLVSVREALGYLYSPLGILTSAARVEQIRNGEQQ